MRSRRRTLLKAAAAAAVVSPMAWAKAARAAQSSARPKVVVVGGGYGGATAAKYVRVWSEGGVDVTLVEREPRFVSCPVSNLVIGGSRQIDDISRSYDGLTALGIGVVRDDAAAIDPVARTVRLASGASLAYDRLVLSPGVDMDYSSIPGLQSADAQARVLHAWKAGAQTLALRRQLEAMPDGGVFVIHIPLVPFRCPPAPYERACQVALYLSRNKPKSKVIILDANEEVQSKKSLFMAAWSGVYKGLVDYRPNSALVDVDVPTLTAKLDFDDVKADVLNVVPPQRAGAIARELGMANANARFCGVDFLTYESTVQPNIHVLGDAIQTASLMPKSGHMANQHGKVAAAAIVALLQGREINRSPIFANACYSFIDDRASVHVSSVHRYDPKEKSMVVVEGSGGVSSAPSVAEGLIADAWARSIWSDMLG